MAAGKISTLLLSIGNFWLSFEWKNDTRYTTVDNPEVDDEDAGDANDDVDVVGEPPFFNKPTLARRNLARCPQGTTANWQS